MTTPTPASNHRPAVEVCAFKQRAMLIWPRLDHRRLAKCACDSQKIAAYVARRTNLSIEDIIAILEGGGRGESEASFYFG